jgi:hypothetical protein
MALNPETWTIKTADAINLALARGREYANPELTPDHLLTAPRPRSRRCPGLVGVRRGSPRSSSACSTSRTPSAAR